MLKQSLFSAGILVLLSACASRPQPSIDNPSAQGAAPATEEVDIAATRRIILRSTDIDAPAFEIIASRSSSFSASDCVDLSEADQQSLIDEHAFGGLPTSNDVLVRRAYVAEYDPIHRVPRWTAWLALPEYRWTPTRKSRWKSFRSDPDVDNPVKDGDYNGLFATTDNFARGHIMPYFISGGDRDGDGRLAAAEDGLTPDDVDDGCTIFEVNYMSNIAPQYHERFNGFSRGNAPDGLWFQLESTIRNLIDSGHAFHIVAGTIFDSDDIQFVGPNADIGVPDMFFKIILTDDGAIPFLFTHRRKLSEEACELTEELSECITTIAEIESLTGLNFLQNLSAEEEASFEGSDGMALWNVLLEELNSLSS